MQIASHLTRSRHDIYYFRFPIPQYLHPERKQSCIRLSLDTHCSQEALHLSYVLGYVGKQLLRQARNSTMEYQAIREVLQEHFKQLLERRKQKIAQQGPLSKQDKIALRNAQRDSQSALDEQDFTFIGNDQDLGRLIETYALPINRNDQSYGILRDEFLKAYSACCDAVLKHDEEQSGYTFEATERSPARKQKAKQLVDAIEEYRAEKLRLKHWREHIAKDYQTQFNLLLRHLGQDASLHISEESARDVKNMLLKLPKHSNKKKELKKLTLPELIELEGYELLSAVTVAKHLMTYSTFYDWAVKCKYTTENNFSSLVDDVKKAHNERAGFSPEDVRRIFNEVLTSKKPHQKWGVLIAFYTGARLNEIAQLDVSDILQQNEIWCFNFSDKGEKKRLKNKASRRVIPIHSHLIELGFLDYMKKVGHERLFPELEFHQKDGYGRNLGRWFNTSLLPELGIKSKALVFHSIRHTVAQKLRNAGVDEPTRKDIMGHSHNDVHHSIYANNLDRRVMREAIEKLSYQ